MKIKTILLLAVGGFFLTPVLSFAQQNFEIGGYVGGQINGGVDLSTTLFHRIEVQNGTNYGITAGYLLGEQHWLPSTDGRLRVSDPDHVRLFGESHFYVEPDQPRELSRQSRNVTSTLTCTATGRPSLMAGLNLQVRTVSIAASSSPIPSERATRMSRG